MQLIPCLKNRIAIAPPRSRSAIACSLNILIMQKPITTKIPNSEINQRVERYRNASINEDGSIDCRKKIEPVTERVRVIKPVSRKADGQYTRETQLVVKFKLVIYPYDQNHIYRRDLKTGYETAIVEKINGEWFPCVILRPSEVQALKSFPGAAGMDIDKAIANKPRCRVHGKSKGVYQVGGKYTYRYDPKETEPETRRNSMKLQKQEADKKRSLLASVQIANVKRK